MLYYCCLLLIIKGLSPQYYVTGGAGHAVRGLYRVHQFTKVELFIVTEGGMGEEESGEELERMVAVQEEICRDLGLHYRCVLPWYHNGVVMVIP